MPTSNFGILIFDDLHFTEEFFYGLFEYSIFWNSLTSNDLNLCIFQVHVLCLCISLFLCVWRFTFISFSISLCGKICNVLISNYWILWFCAFMNLMLLNSRWFCFFLIDLTFLSHGPNLFFTSRVSIFRTFQISSTLSYFNTSSSTLASVNNINNLR